MDFTLNTHELDTNLSQFPPRLLAALEMYADTAAQTLEAQAKRNRPWTDRTSRARQGLKGTSDREGTVVRIVLAHTVDYGVWLELAHEKNWAIVEPTMRLEQDGITNGLQRLLDKVKV